MVTSNTNRAGRGRSDNNALGRLLLLFVLIGLLTAVVWGSGQYLSDRGGNEIGETLTHEVQRDDLVVSITEDGNVESGSNVEMKCQVAGGSSILWIIQDGSTVNPGDKLVELDSSALEEQISQQKITFEKARSAMIQAEKNYAVAKLAVREYLEGTFKKELQDAETQITIALENLRSAENSLEHSERMFRKGYVSNLELEGQRFAVERAKLERDSALTAKEVLVNFAKVKMLEDLESQRDTAEAAMKSEKAAFELEESRLERLEDQIKNCTIVAEQGGMVVYANDRGRWRGQDQATIEEGAAVRERQTILRLPDLSKMQVKVNVHESKVEELAIGMRASVRIRDRTMQGKVESIANQPEPTSFFSADVKEYATTVRIGGTPDGLKPGMTAEVEILIAHLKDVLSVPVAAVVEGGSKYFAWIESNDGFEKRELVLGKSNDQFVEVKDGIKQGDVVLLNPRAIVAEARELGNEDAEGSERTVTDRFGEAGPGGTRAGGPSASAPSASGPSAGGPGRNRGPGGGGPGPGSPGAGSPGAGGRGGGGGGGFLSRLDTDGDGKVSKEEAPEQMREGFDRMDTNGDGFITTDELQALRNRGGDGRRPE